jgi:hypothetical protein
MAALEQRLTSQILMLETATTLDQERLLDIDGIDRFEAINARRARLHFSGDNPAGRVAARVNELGWGLIELALDRQTLEQVFVDLTCSDQPSEDAA